MIRSSTLRRAFSQAAVRRRELLPTTSSPIVTTLDFFNSVAGKDKQIPTYRLLDGVGQPLEGAVLPEVLNSSLRTGGSF
ncbi:hypothetical protein NLJ89_g12041 [Agrocybe chaxingu]|uniref:Uncharacterized protein n=1 Tax=Agrocybe chaxingu TaxID=84603 RepID=A0A9W8MNV2_9AGAR|nr:hypothetical protein NLJ89_g12041 [Agrocybe chaxingu]